MPHGERKQGEPETEEQKKHRETIDRIIGNLKSERQPEIAVAHEASVQNAQKKQRDQMETDIEEDLKRRKRFTR